MPARSRMRERNGGMPAWRSSRLTPLPDKCQQSVSSSDGVFRLPRPFRAAFDLPFQRTYRVFRSHQLVQRTRQCLLACADYSLRAAFWFYRFPLVSPQRIRPPLQTTKNRNQPPPPKSVSTTPSTNTASPCAMAPNSSPPFISPKTPRSPTLSSSIARLTASLPTASTTTPSASALHPFSFATAS